MIRVLCSDSELDEGGEVIAVGEHVSRLAARIQNVYYGTDLDAIEWRFDQYADAIGYESATISGQVIAISAVFVRLTAAPGGGWTARLGSAHLEPLETTASTRKIEHEVMWGTPSPTNEHGYAYRTGSPRLEEGDEYPSGWVFTLASARIGSNLAAD